MSNYVYVALAFFICLIVVASSLETGTMVPRRRRSPPPSPSLPPPPPPVPPFDFFMLAETWPPTFCKVNKCGKNVPSPSKFTIHGLWAEKSFGPDPPGDCKLGEGFELNKLTMITKLEREWPDLTGSPTKKYGLWIYEWENHGRCTSLDQSDYFNLALQIHKGQDIKSILREYKKSITPSDRKPVDRDTIVQAIKDRINYYPQLQCIEVQNNIYLLEVRLCVNVLDRKLRNCPSRFGEGCTKQDVYFPL